MDERANMFACQRTRQITWFQSVDHLDLAHVGCAEHVLHHNAFKDQVVRVKVEQLLGGNFRDELRSVRGVRLS